MTYHHHATPDEWAQQTAWAQKDSDSSCIVELLHRIEALEAAQRFDAGLTDADIKAAELAWARTAPGMRSDDLRLPAKPERQDKLDRLIEQDRSNAQQLTLVERVADAINPLRHLPDDSTAQFTSETKSRVAIRVVAVAALQMHPDPNLTWERVALWLEQEANQ